jgi:hypothetical protein
MGQSSSTKVVGDLPKRCSMLHVSLAHVLMWMEFFMMFHAHNTVRKIITFQSIFSAFQSIKISRFSQSSPPSSLSRPHRPSHAIYQTSLRLLLKYYYWTYTLLSTRKHSSLRNM